MRTFIRRSFDFIASYPVLALLLIAIVILIYLGQQYRPVVQENQSELARSMQIRKEREALQQELGNVEMSDLRKRYTLYNKNFLSEGDAVRSSLIESVSSALNAFGWELQEHSFQPLEAPKNLTETAENEATKIRAVLLDVVANADGVEEVKEDPFLPLFSLFEAKKYLWSRSPDKEYQRIKIQRTETGYQMESTLFLPIGDSRPTGTESE